IPPGSPPAGTWKARPDRRILPETPEVGTLMTQVLAAVSNVVVEVEAVTVGSNVSLESGTGRGKVLPVAVKSMYWVTDSTGVVVLLLRPLTLRTLLNQMYLFWVIAVPLKLLPMLLAPVWPS